MARTLFFSFFLFFVCCAEHAETTVPRFDFFFSCFCRYACQEPDLVYVSYLHSKGSRISPSHAANATTVEQHNTLMHNAEVWRQLGEHFVLDQFPECVTSGADMCGPLWLEEPYFHFSGNFWTAKCSHVRRLSPSHLMVADHIKNRLNAESWLGLYLRRAREPYVFFLGGRGWEDGHASTIAK